MIGGVELIVAVLVVALIVGFSLGVLVGLMIGFPLRSATRASLTPRDKRMKDAVRDGLLILFILGAYAWVSDIDHQVAEDEAAVRLAARVEVNSADELPEGAPVASFAALPLKGGQQ